MPDERILLVGGNGFIGRALGRRLVADGKEVHVLSRQVVPGLQEGMVCHRGCQSEVAVVAPLLERCAAVVHLASTTTPGRSAHAPVLDAIENLVPLAGFLEILAAAGPKPVVFLSSGGAIYGNPASLPVSEDHPAQPLSYHAAGKIAAEAFFAAFARQTGTAPTILRAANVYGPGQSLQTGFGIVRTLLEKARSGEPLELWGSGEQLRDYLYIDDLVDACLRLVDAPEVVGTFNAGSGTGVSLLELVGIVRKVTGRQIEASLRPERRVDVEAIYLECRKLSAAVGWAPQVPLEEGVGRAWAWLQGQ
jgi:UDP-glucose 4-epimerase